jgi:hypothetical protein
MSSEHQPYSPENKLEIIRPHAAAHNMEIVQDYSGHGQNGLKIAGRAGINWLITDVKTISAHFALRKEDCVDLQARRRIVLGRRPHLLDLRAAARISQASLAHPSAVRR